MWRFDAEKTAGGITSSIVLSGGSEVILARGTDVGAQSSAATQLDCGSATGATVFTGGSQTVETGGTMLLAGEGIETVLSLKCVLPDLPMIAALSANHLSALDLAPMLARLYIARDSDTPGRIAAERLHARASTAHIEVQDLVPVWGDFNQDLRRLGAGMLRAHLSEQFAPPDVLRFLGGQQSS